MSPQNNASKTCAICSGETRDAFDEFCATCERRMEVAFHKMSTEGAAVMVPVRVN